MEILREWGLHKALEEAGLPRDESLYVFSGVSLLATEFKRSGWSSGVTDAASPTQRLLCDQMAMEGVLLDQARALGVDLRFSTTVTGFDQDENAVTVDVVEQESGRESKLRAEWLIGADGARSAVRSRLGFGRSGSGRHGSAVSIYFHAPLGERMVGRTAGRYDVANTPGATVMVVDNDRRWLIIRNHDPSVEPSELFTPEWALELARCAVGDPTVPIDIIGVRQWDSFTLVADRYRDRRVFLIGDAAHVTTPIGGLGMNCGIADVHNLAWKVAGAIEGWAGPALLDSYETERRPVAVATAEASRGAARPPATADGIVLGYRYESAVIESDGTDPPILDDPVNDYVPTARPGHRAPHMWLDAEHTRSTLDCFGGSFTILTDASGRATAERGSRSPQSAGTPVRVIALDDPRWADLYGCGRGGAVVVRPDGHVAARHFGPKSTADGLEQCLLRASGQLPAAECRTSTAETVR
ncbi:MAG: FAD-dependent oxidoreductase [Acidimicrobiales bacterium]